MFKCLTENLDLCVGFVTENVYICTVLNSGRYKWSEYRGDNSSWGIFSRVWGKIPLHGVCFLKISDIFLLKGKQKNSLEKIPRTPKRKLSVPLNYMLRITISLHLWPSQPSQSCVQYEIRLLLYTSCQQTHNTFYMIKQSQFIRSLEL